MKHSLSRDLMIGAGVGLFLSYAALSAHPVPAHDDPTNVHILLLTVAFDSKGEVAKYFINGFPDKDSCVSATIALAAEASKQLGDDVHVGQSLCFGDATVYGGKAPAVPYQAKPEPAPKAPQTESKPGYKGPITNL
jgi:hypothetical protein